jgi:D-mannonate dehydratase
VIRIYTEGEKTEPNYFNAIKNELRLNEIDIKVHGMGYNTMPLVEWVVDEKNSVKDIDEDTDWWVVFDKDNFSIFDQAIEKAISEGIKVAYSNECFELWFILHFDFLNTAIGREKYYEKLTHLLSRKYDKNISGIYDFIKDKEGVAIRNARKLEEEHDREGVHLFSKRDPSTTVYKLIEQLRALKVDL